jgi:predicted amidohydrolase YtcJ
MPWLLVEGRAWLSAAAPCPAVVVADRVYTGFRPTRMVEAFLAVGGRVAYAGYEAEALRLARLAGEALGCRPRVHRVEGVVAPGFVDAHLHLAALGFEAGGLDLRGVEDIEELKRLVAEAARRRPRGWIYGRGWDQDSLGTWPTRYDLDEAAPGRPVLLMRVCGHAAVASTEALRLLGLLGEEARASPHVDRGCDGAPTGILFEDEAWRAYREARRSTDPAKIVLEGQERLLRAGVTTAATMGADAHEARGLLGAWRSGALRMRVRVYLDWGLYEALHQAGLVPAGLGDEMLRITGVKLYMDGSLGARTAWLREPYSDDPGNTGRRLLDARGLARRASIAASDGLDVAVHAIGDAAVLEAARGLAAAGVRGRVEHASLAPREAVEALREAGARAVVQPGFIISDYWAHERLGDRVRSLYPFRSMLSAGLVLGFSSDAPVEPPSPLRGVYAAAARPGPIGEATPGERLDVETALHLYTQGSALALGEPRLGCLEPGCHADAVVLSEDPLEAPLDLLPDITVLATMVAGEWAYRKA